MTTPAQITPAQIQITPAIWAEVEQWAADGAWWRGCTRRLKVRFRRAYDASAILGATVTVTVYDSAGDELYAPGPDPYPLTMGEVATELGRYSEVLYADDPDGAVTVTVSMTSPYTGAWDLDLRAADQPAELRRACSSPNLGTVDEGCPVLVQIGSATTGASRDPEGEVASGLTLTATITQGATTVATAGVPEIGEGTGLYRAEMGLAGATGALTVTITGGGVDEDAETKVDVSKSVRTRRRKI